MNAFQYLSQFLTIQILYFTCIFNVPSNASIHVFRNAFCKCHYNNCNDFFLYSLLIFSSSKEQIHKIKLIERKHETVPLMRKKINPGVRAFSLMFYKLLVYLA